MPYTKEEARQKIQKLVDDFRAHYELYVLTKEEIKIVEGKSQHG